jgi:hypothetical protein
MRSSKAVQVVMLLQAVQAAQLLALPSLMAQCLQQQPGIPAAAVMALQGTMPQGLVMATKP